MYGYGGSSTWITDPGASASNPLDFQRFKDCHDENARTLLDGSGQPLEIGGSPVYVSMQFYKESDFLLLGIPASL